MPVRVRDTATGLVGVSARTLILARPCFVPCVAGPRLCLGMSMAYLEAEFMIASLLQKFEIKVEPGRTGRGTALLSVHGLPS